MSERLAGCKNLNIKKEVVISIADLPLQCPIDANIACSHPRVYLAIETTKTKTSRCPYCGTLYRLIDTKQLA
ncbi:MAG: zinc-finger domain-containing protein [Cocleimonas sp.]|nr:zinc-finger domain-containing protein [Cocleimonas sp.]